MFEKPHITLDARDFFVKIIHTYIDARKSIIPHEKIHRGRSHSISSQTEDLFAEFILTTHPSLDKIYVDKPMSYTCIKENRTKQFYPDLALVRNGSITNFIDVKMDLGWNRNGMGVLCRKHKETISAIANTTVRMKTSDKKETMETGVSPKVNYLVAVLSGANISKELLKKQQSDAKKYEPMVSLHILSGGVHPNNYAEANVDQLLDDIQIDHREWSKFWSFLSPTHS